MKISFDIKCYVLWYFLDALKNKLQWILFENIMYICKYLAAILGKYIKSNAEMFSITEF